MTDKGDGIPLARRYLQITGLSPADARDALVWSRPGTLISAETLTADDLATYRQANQRWYAGLRRVSGDDADDEPIWVNDNPNAEELTAELQAIEARALECKMARRTHRLAGILTVDGGREIPDPLEWLAREASLNSEPGCDPEVQLLLGLEALTTEANDTESPDHSESEGAEADLASAIYVASAGLGDRSVFPAALIDSAFSVRADAAEKLVRIRDNKILAYGDTIVLLREAAASTLDRRQLSELTTAEIRALVAVFRIFSSAGDSGRAFHQSALLVPARTFYQAADIDIHDGSARRRMFHAIDALSRRLIYVTTRVRENDREWIVGERCPVVLTKPRWYVSRDGRRRLTEREVASITLAWTAGHAPADEIRVPLPDAYEFTLPLSMQKLWDRLVLSGDVLSRLDLGAKKARGPTESFDELDFQLFIEITQRIQASRVGEGGDTLQSYVDRDALLSDHYGARYVKQKRARGKYYSNLVAQYEKAVATLEAGGLARRVEKQKANRRGNNPDVFEPNPDVMFGLRERATAAIARKAAAARPKRTIGKGKT